MHGVAKRIENRRQIVRDIVGDFKGVKRRDHQIFGKTARTVDADARRIAAQMRTPGAAVTAVAAGDMPFAGNAVAQLKAANLLTDTHHFADVFI